LTTVTSRDSSVSFAKNRPNYDTPVSDRRVNMVIARLRTIFATARRRKPISEDPMKYVDNLREPKPDVDPLTLEEAQRLLAAALGQDRVLFTVLIFTGLRRTRRWHLIGLISISTAR
jgi:integrase